MAEKLLYREAKMVTHFVVIEVCFLKTKNILWHKDETHS